MRSLVAVWRGRSRRAKVALVAVPALCLLAASSALATGFFGGNSLNPDPQYAAKIVGIEQLVANYTNDVDWGPISGAPNGIGRKRRRAIGRRASARERRRRCEG